MGTRTVKQAGVVKYPPETAKEIFRWARDVVAQYLWRSLLDDPDHPNADTLIQYCKKLVKAPGRPSTVERFYLDMKGWEYRDKLESYHNYSLKVFLKLQDCPRRVGQWDERIDVLEVCTGSLDRIKSVDGFRRLLFEMRRTVQHELEHTAQTLLQKVLWLQEKGGLPSKRIREDPTKFIDPATGRVPHELRDIEFYPNLGDALETFSLNIREIPKEAQPTALRYWLGLIDKNKLRDQLTREIKDDERRFDLESLILFDSYRITKPFHGLKAKQRDKWKKAVKVFISEIQRRGYRLPSSGIKVARYRDTETLSITETAREFEQAWKLFLERLEMGKERAIGSRRPEKTIKIWTEDVWDPLMWYGEGLSDQIIKSKAIPKGKEKKLEMAARLFGYGVKRLPTKVVSWVDKNKAGVDLLLEAARTWADRGEDAAGDAPAQVGNFTVVDSVHLNDKQLQATKKNIEDVQRRIKQSGIPKADQVLYGNIMLVGKIRGTAAAWYKHDADEIYLRPLIKKLTDRQAHDIVHELGHRYWEKVLPSDKQKAWRSHHRDLEFGQTEDVKVEPGVVLRNTRITGIKGDPVIDRIDNRFVYFVGSDAKVDRMSVWKLLHKQAERALFPTDYASTDPVEHFCEAFSMYVNGNLPDKHKMAFDEIITGKAGKQAGWWRIKGPNNPGGLNTKPLVDKGGLLNAIPGVDPGNLALYNGDGPADLMDGVLNDIDLLYRAAWGRRMKHEEAQAVFNFCSNILKPDPAGVADKYIINEWVDKVADLVGMEMQQVAQLPRQVLDALKKAWRDYRNSNIQTGVWYSNLNPPPPRTREAWDQFVATVRNLLGRARQIAARTVPLSKGTINHAASKLARQVIKTLQRLPQDRQLGITKRLADPLTVPVKLISGEVVPVEIQVLPKRGKAHWMVRSHQIVPGGWAKQFADPSDPTKVTEREIEVYVNGNYTPGEILTKYVGNGTEEWSLEYNIRRVLLHEMTHIVDPGSLKPHGKEPYLDRPTEVRARAQEIADQVLSHALKSAEDLEGFTTIQSLVEHGLENSTTWDSVRKQLSPESKKYILKVVYQTVSDREYDLITKWLEG